MNVVEFIFTYEKLLDELKPGRGLYSIKKNFIFRGQAIDWKLVPFALREEQKELLPDIMIINHMNDSSSDYKFILETTKKFYSSMHSESLCREIEYIYLKTFYKYANNVGLKLPKTNFKSADYIDLMSIECFKKITSMEWISDDLAELAALAQHYGVPTRLLDWSFDIYVALYFASFNAIKMIVNSEIKKFKSNGIDTDYLVIWFLEHYILENEIGEYPNEAPPIRFVIPNYSDNPNICAQKGILSYWKTPKIEIQNGKLPDNDVCREPLDNLLKKFEYNKIGKVPVLYKVKIPISESLTILKHVSSLGYNAATMFPGYYGVKQKIDEDIMIEHAKPIFEKEFTKKYSIPTAANNTIKYSKPSTEKMSKSDINEMKEAPKQEY